MIPFSQSRDEFKLASLFLLILSPNYSDRLMKDILLSEESERRLYLALEDDIFILAQINPLLYFQATGFTQKIKQNSRSSKRI